jgi:hypothetical protein
MSASINRFLIIEQGIVPGLFNFFINGGIAWWLNQHLDFMPLWGKTSIAVDTLATALLLPLITCVIVTPIIASKVNKGSLTPLELPLVNDAKLPARSSFLRGLLAGAIGVFCFAIPVLALWNFFGPQQLELHDFIWFKAGFAAVLGTLITALIAWWALVDASRRLT